MCSIYQTFESPSKVLGEGHPFGHWKVFCQAIATDMNQKLLEQPKAQDFG
jgi:hypothetical protein